MESHPLGYFLSEKKTPKQNKTQKLDKKFVSNLNSHRALDLHTTNLKLSSVTSNHGISILPKHRGEDNEDSGKLDLQVYLGQQIFTLMLELLGFFCLRVQLEQTPLTTPLFLQP